MRFLCLHGMGTNGKVFEVQTAKIRGALGNDHEYIFVDGTVSTTPAPGVQPFSSPGEEFLRFVNDDDVESYRKLYEELKDFVSTEGPFEGIMGFSEGAGLAVSLVVDQIHQLSSQGSSCFHFKCAILFCAADPVDTRALQKGQIHKIDGTNHREVVNIPTAHIWAHRDDVHAGFGEAASQICANGPKEEYIHSLGHTIPGSQSDEGIFETVRAIQRTIERAS